MPYIKEKHEIRTKLAGVLLEIDGVNRQNILNAIRKSPEKVTNMCIKGDNVHVVFDMKEYIIGRIKGEYLSLLATNDAEITDFAITGGYDIEEEGNTSTTNLGCNVIIQLTKKDSLHSKDYVNLSKNVEERA